MQRMSLRQTESSDASPQLEMAGLFVNHTPHLLALLYTICLEYHRQVCPGGQSHVQYQAGHQRCSVPLKHTCTTYREEGSAMNDDTKALPELQKKGLLGSRNTHTDNNFVNVW